MTQNREKLFSVRIEDCRVECIASTHGAGGQNKNRRHTAVRITHPPSGAVGYSADENNQLKNKIDAFRKLAKSREFMAWARLRAAEMSSGKTLEERVEEEMAPENLRVEVRKDGVWEEWNDSETT